MSSSRPSGPACSARWWWERAAQVPVGELIAVIAEPADDIGTVVASASAAPAPAAAAPAPRPPRRRAGAVAGAPPGRRPSRPPPRRGRCPPPRPTSPRRRRTRWCRSRPSPARRAGQPPRRWPPRQAPTGPRLVATGAPRAAAAGVSRPRRWPRRSRPSPAWISPGCPGQRSRRPHHPPRRRGGAGRAAGRAVPARHARARRRPPPSPARAPFVIPARTEAEYEDVPLTPMRATIAKRMPMSKAPVPHFYVTSEVGDGPGVGAARGAERAGRPAEGLRRPTRDQRACALALLKHPGVNASAPGPGHSRVPSRPHRARGGARAAASSRPCCATATSKPLAQIAVEARDLAERARAGKLRASELSGATFSISNLGMFDVEEFSAIINPPEGAILAVGSVLEKPVVVDGDARASGAA